MTFSYIWIMVLIIFILFSIFPYLVPIPPPGKPFYFGNGGGVSQTALKGHCTTTEKSCTGKLDPLYVLNSQRGSHANRY